MMSSEANAPKKKREIKQLPSAMVFSLFVAEHDLKKPTRNVRKIDQTQPCNEKTT